MYRRVCRLIWPPTVAWFVVAALIAGVSAVPQWRHASQWLMLLEVAPVVWLLLRMLHERVHVLPAFGALLLYLGVCGLPPWLLFAWSFMDSIAPGGNTPYLARVFLPGLGSFAVSVVVLAAGLSLFLLTARGLLSLVERSLHSRGSSQSG